METNGKKGRAYNWVVRLLSPWRHRSLAVLLPALGIAATGTCAAFADPRLLGAFEPEVAAPSRERPVFANILVRAQHGDRFLARILRPHRMGTFAALLQEQPNRPSLESPRADDSSPAEGNPLPDGIYLYGESPQPEQIQRTYLVFEVRRGLTVGAIYMPSSSFDCFYGNAGARQLKLTIVNSYEQSSYNFSIPLKEFHAIASVSDNDSRILSMCKDSYQELVWGK